MKRRSKPRREFSKIIVCTVGAVTIFVTAFTCVMVWRTSNTDALAYLIPAIFGEAATATGFYYSKAKTETESNFAGNTATWSTRRNEPMFEIIIGNLIKIGYAMAIFLCAYLANVVFSLWYNIKINCEPFSREKLATGGLKALTFIVGLTLLCIAITTLPIFATEVGWTIPDEYAELFADLIIVGAVLLVACKYIKEAFTKFVAILNTPADTVPAKEGKEHEQQPVSDVFQDQPEPDQPQES